MGYVEQTLLSGEKVYYRTRLHWIVMFGHLFFGLLLGALGIAAVIAFSVRTPEEGRTLFGIGAIALLVAAVVVIAAGMVKRNSTEIAVTNKRVLIKTGILRRGTMELLLTKIESVGVNEPILGRMLGYGTVTVRGTGGTPELFERIAKPLEFRRQIQGQIEGVGPGEANLPSA